VKQQGYVIGNVDLTLLAEAPRIGKYSQAMRECLAADLEANIPQINIKATTTERLGYIGREEGLAAHAVVLLESAT
jgi:2-C-methyl-D-erythritol 2,4-cyclodiphosphate synthase